MVARTIERAARQRARKYERKDEEVAWLMQQRTRLCMLCRKGYTANSRSTPDKLRVRRWHGVEVCRDCEANNIETIQALLFIGILKYTPEHKEKRRLPDRWKQRDPAVFEKHLGQPGQVWAEGCDICKVRYLVIDGQRKMKWKGFVICHHCLKGIRLVPRLVKAGVVKYAKEY